MPVQELYPILVMTLKDKKKNLPIHELRGIYLFLCLKHYQMFDQNSQENFPTYYLIRKKDLDGCPTDQKLSSQNWEREIIIMSIIDQPPFAVLEQRDINKEYIGFSSFPKLNGPSNQRIVGNAECQVENKTIEKCMHWHSFIFLVKNRQITK